MLNSTMMRAVLWSGIPFNVTVGNYPRPTIQNSTDVIVRVTAAAICGSDLHLYRGTRTPPTGPTDPVPIGHEAMGYVAEVGEGVNFLSVGDFVVIPDRTDEGHLLMEPHSYTAYGSAALPGSQAEYVRVPYADNGLIPIETTNGTEPLIDYLFLSDIFPTAWTALDYSGFQSGDTVAIFGAGPVGQLAIHCAMLRGASKVYSIDSVPARLELAASQGAIPISFNTSDPVAQILAYEPNGVRRTVDCVGYEAVNSSMLPQENAVLQNMINSTSINGGLGVAGVYHVYEPEAYSMPLSLGAIWAKALKLSSGAVNPMTEAPRLADLIATGRARPSFIISANISIEDAPEYYARFEQHRETKVVIQFPMA
ncbi:hypothetical protein BP6252_08963 [Coleophoma cylindrospora]|uniref:GroES-like protein n=1 Tax=Coleophoma cylindrospora TaxID=1849047 RepID=A0A3D8R0K3_9HELO|nr:hypothetical protein BP6252_08963 [Coleophoma cylindrospora]